MCIRDRLEWASTENDGLPIRRLPPQGDPFSWQDIPLQPGSPLSRKRTRGVSLYPQERLYQEMAFLAYYLHWSNEALMTLDPVSYTHLDVYKRQQK